MSGGASAKGIVSFPKNQYRSEDALIEDFIGILQSGSGPFSDLYVRREFSHTDGRTDVVALNEKNKLYTFEAKLKKWKWAARQALRNTVFAHYSYVILPSSMENTVDLGFDLLAETKIGLAFIERGRIRIAKKARHLVPIHKRRNREARRYALEGNGQIHPKPGAQECRD